MNLPKTASGRIAEVFAIRRFLFRFITRWSTSKNEEDFLEKLKKDVRKWEKKFGKEEEMAAVTKKSTEKSTTAKETMAMATMAKNVTAMANNMVKAKTTVTANKTVMAAANLNNKTTDAPAPRPIPRPTMNPPVPVLVVIESLTNFLMTQVKSCWFRTQPLNPSSGKEGEERGSGNDRR